MSNYEETIEPSLDPVDELAFPDYRIGNEEQTESDVLHWSKSVEEGE